MYIFCQGELWTYSSNSC